MRFDLRSIQLLLSNAFKTTLSFYKYNYLIRKYIIMVKVSLLIILASLALIHQISSERAESSEITGLDPNLCGISNLTVSSLNVGEGGSSNDYFCKRLNDFQCVYFCPSSGCYSDCSGCLNNNKFLRGLPQCGIFNIGELSEDAERN